MRSTSERLLKDRIFLAGLGALLLNDLLLKYIIPGFVTGKLSDIAGLFIFPFFWSAFLFRYRVAVFVFTALGFIFWKIPASESLIALVNSALGIQMHRTVDYSDLMALLIMPVSYWRLECRARLKVRLELHSFAGAAIVALALFSFVATTLPRHVMTLNIPVDTSYVIESGREVILSRMTHGMPGADSLQKDQNDSLFYITFFTKGASVMVKTSIYETAVGKTTVDLMLIESAIVSGGLFFSSFNKDKRRLEAMEKSDFVKMFEEEVIDHLKEAGRSRQIHYWSESLHKHHERY